MDEAIESLQADIQQNKEQMSTLIQSQTETLTTSINNFKSYVANELTKVKTSVTDLETKVNINIEDITLNSQKIDLNSETLATLKDDNKNLLDKIKTLEKELAAQTDREMRCTLSFRGVYEEENENYYKTPKVLANLLHKMESKSRNNNKMTYTKILEAIDRAHRSSMKAITNDANQENLEDDAARQPRPPRPIYVKFTSWKVSDYLKTIVINYNKNLLAKGKNPSVFVDNLFSSHTNARRKNAFKKLKSLKDSGLQAKMYVKYPATVAVKNNETGKYVDHTVF